MIRVLIADDHQMFIDGVKALLANETDIKTKGQALNGKEVLKYLKNNIVDIVLMDINMPILDGIEATKIISKEFPYVKVLILTMHNNIEYVNRIINAGALGYILKNTGKKELIEAIVKVYNGEKFYSREVTATMVESFNSHTKPEPKKENIKLSRREFEILKLISQEQTTIEIAKELNISQHTIDTHRRNLLNKLNVRNTAGLIKYALSNNIIQLD